ncbi:hypothetical protein G3447_03265 [Shewanella baltica]|nr:hypothetical protein [Shewanella baltica]
MLDNPAVLIWSMLFGVFWFLHLWQTPRRAHPPSRWDNPDDLPLFCQ